MNEKYLHYILILFALVTLVLNIDQWRMTREKMKCSCHDNEESTISPLQ